MALTLALLAAPAANGQGLGPAPRAADGRFLNEVGPIQRAGPGVTIPFFLRRALGAFRGRPGAPERVGNDGAFLRDNALHSVPTATWVGHATLLVQMDHQTFLTDPIWSKTASPLPRPFGPRRFVPPGIALDDLPPVDFVVISHNHYDHLDIDSLAQLAVRRPATRFFVPLGNAAVLREAGIENVEELDWGESRAVGATTVHCLPSQHWSARGLRDERRGLWASWAVTGPERRFYFAGDTGWFDGFGRIGASLGPFDLAALPIGAYEPEAMMRPFHLDPEEAVRAGLALRSQTLLGIHWGTFDLTDEPLDEPPARFRAASEAAGLDDARAWLMRVGETRRW